ncbi:CU044_5270 family protein [Actinomadura opuntiae]|uniref:CU044_5270 family protein n=1 Tax=Actinomadura sp. OS1-43 TaxID=604315 RepID=UPI00255ADA6E|nr:CU044_5270 family protein [Actinomadura sp. OS1-43]MDL4817639.1 CU044_5270 family protein [Actinomadura sp. OS1-43]
MNELKEVGAFRAQVPEPGRERLAPGRERLVRAAAGRSRSRFRFRVPAWRAGLAVGVAVAGAAAVTVVVVDRNDPAPAPIAARPVSATGVLERAAKTVAGRPDHRPAPNEWVYTRTYQAGQQDAPSFMQHMEGWVRFDGRKTARYDGIPGKKPRLEVTDVKRDGDSEERSPAQWYDYLRALPDDASALLAGIDRRAKSYNAESHGRLFNSEDGRDQWVFGRLVDFLGQGPSTPQSRRATIFRALARIPGVQVKEGTKDALGRPGTTVSRTGPDGLREEFVLARGTYDYLGLRFVVVKDQRLPKARARRGGPAVIPAGTVTNEQALEKTALVDRPGQRP